MKNCKPKSMPKAVTPQPPQKAGKMKGVRSTMKNGKY